MGPFQVLWRHRFVLRLGPFQALLAGTGCVLPRSGPHNRSAPHSHDRSNDTCWPALAVCSRGVVPISFGPVFGWEKP